MTKNSAAKATGAHISVVGHMTLSELRLLPDREALNGFGNRFLWLAVRRSKLLPNGGKLASVDLSGLVQRIKCAVDFARKTTELKRNPAAEAFWEDLYPVLSAGLPGLLGAITNRAEVMVMRMALIYALLDESPAIEVQHLRAALAVWDYAERSAAFIFGESLGDRIADRLLDEIRGAGPSGLSQNALRELFQRNVSARSLAGALALLEGQRLVRKCPRTPTGQGRPPVFWVANPYAINAVNAETGSASRYSAFLASTWTPSVTAVPAGSPAVQPPSEGGPGCAPAGDAFRPSTPPQPDQEDELYV